MKYEIIINIAGEIHRVYRHAKNQERAFALACIDVAKKTGHLPNPWAIQINDYSIKEIKTPLSDNGGIT